MTGPKTILGFGASSMQGACDSQGGFFKRLELRLNHDSDRFRFVNLGIGGNTTRDMLARIGDIEKYRPFDSVVLLGSNDMPRPGDGNPGHRTSLEEYGRNLEIILPKLRGERSLFISSFYVKWIKESIFASYMAVATEIACKNGYQYWDLLSDSHPSLSRYIASDFTHFNDEGHQYIADHVAGFFAEPQSS